MFPCFILMKQRICLRGSNLTLCLGYSFFIAFIFIRKKDKHNFYKNIYTARFSRLKTYIQQRKQHMVLYLLSRYLTTDTQKTDRPYYMLTLSNLLVFEFYKLSVQFCKIIQIFCSFLVTFIFIHF